MKIFVVALVVVLAAVLALPNVALATPLDDYISAPDPTFSWKVNNTFRSTVLGYTAYNIELVSQTWMTSNETNQPVWKHWLQVCVPDQPDTRYSDSAFLYIDGGHTKDPVPKSFNLVPEFVCFQSRTVGVALLQIPNQPIVYYKDGKGRSEDAMIAYAWRHFLNNTDLLPEVAIWLPRLPMTKAVVKAMDAVQAFIATLKNPSIPAVNNFVVAGASKRGWTTWTAAAVDKRIVGIVPMVMPILNIVPNMNHHYQAYGGWSFALSDYLQQGCMGFLNKPEFLDMAAIVDPYTYRDRLTMPKMILTATGDEFFLPDSPQFFINELPGETHLNLIPDAEHALVTAYVDVTFTLSGFYQMVISKTPRPSYTYEIIKSNTTASIKVQVDTANPPTSVTLWHASTLSSTMRDFRLVKCAKLPDCLNPVIWYYEELQEALPGSGKYLATKSAPIYGWTGFLVELVWEYRDWPRAGQLRKFITTTEVNIVPDTMPFAPCGDHCQ
jgi:PhoPQ-activated pathogenicity-related protein